MNILCVDDDEGILDMYESIFRLGYRLFSCKSVNKARDILARYDIDVVLLDLNMPEMNGLDFLPELREQYPAVPVVVVSGDCFGEKMLQAERCGAAACFEKPFYASDLVERVSEVVMMAKGSE